VSYVEGEDRNQAVLFPECLDDYINEDNPIRFVDAFVEGLDLGKLGFQEGKAERHGSVKHSV
jgi:transposase